MFEYPPDNETTYSNSPTDVTHKSQALTKNQLKGIWVPVVTPFKNNELDLEALSKLTKSLVESNVHGLVACSTTGEFGSLSFIEQTKVIETVLNTANNKVPVLVGINGMGTHELIKHAQTLANLDISGFLIAPPPFVRPSQEGLIQHFNHLADATSKSVVLYNVPGRSGV